MRISSVTDIPVAEMKGRICVRQSYISTSQKWELRSGFLPVEVMLRGEIRRKCWTHHANVLSRTSALELASLYL